MNTTMIDAMRINAQDNVAVALRDLDGGHCVQLDSPAITLLEAIPKGHKFALHSILAGGPIIKYNASIGHASQAINQGSHVHTHNLVSSLNNQNDYGYTRSLTSNHPPDFSFIAPKQLFAYRRNNGAVAIRNELWIIPTVTCVNAIADIIKNKFLQAHPELTIDAVEVLKHPYGCSQLGDDHKTTRTMLQNMVQHPHAGAVLVIGLGCENNQVSEFMKTLGDYDPERVRFMVCQEARDEISVALNHLETLYEVMRYDRRSSINFSELKFGLECGGSDAFSGITANPLLGDFSDFIVTNGGTTVLTEVPEMFGAEQDLMNRAQDQNTYEKIVAMIVDFKRYFIEHHQPIYENPSPGNKVGGITTLEEKSIGCTQKSGTTAVMDVLKYGARLKIKGLNLLSAPGNDAVATSALIAAGCHMVLFSTGRGTPYGGLVPTLKIATNSELATLKAHWIDFNAGVLLEACSREVVLGHLITRLCDFINGEKTANEKIGFKALAIFKSGVTL